MGKRVSRARQQHGVGSPPQHAALMPRTMRPIMTHMQPNFLPACLPYVYLNSSSTM